MDLGVTEQCQFEETPGKRGWVTDDPDTASAPADEPMTCARETVADADYCAFHLPEAEREARDIDTGERLRERLETVAEGGHPARETPTSRARRSPTPI